MEIKTLESESSLHVTIRGILDTPNSIDLEKFLDSKTGLGYRKFLLDLSMLESLSSGGISFFVRIHEKSKSSPVVHFALTGLNSEVQKLFRFFGLDHKLKVFPSLDLAKEYLGNIPSRDPARVRSKTLDSTGVAISGEKTDSTRPYKDKIRFYYKGHIRPSRFPKQPDSPKNSDPVPAEEPLSSLESVEEVPKERSPFAKADPVPSNGIKTDLQASDLSSAEIFRRLETKLEELKRDFLEQRKGQTEKPEPVERKDSSPISAKAFSGSSPETIWCESCGTKLRVFRKGHYKCPSCGTEFYYKGLKSISYLEKLISK